MAPNDIAIEDVQRAETKTIDDFGRVSVGRGHSGKVVTIYELTDGSVVAEVQPDDAGADE